MHNVCQKSGIFVNNPHSLPYWDMKILKNYKCTELITFSTWFTLVFVGNLADLIFVFFDPIGQALCKRTLNLVGKLNV